jgi:hypothetical protein
VFVVVVTVGSSCLAEEPVVFGHWAIRAAVEEQLWIVDPTPTDMLGLLSLSCIAREVDSIEGLQYAQNLQTLTLSDNNHISDISVLSGLKELEVLVVNQNNIRDISVVRELTKLRHLDIHHNGLDDISAVSGLVHLERFVARENSIQDIQPLATLARLHTLIMRYNPISDIRVLAQLGALKTIDLHGTLVSDITALLSLPRLDKLVLTSAHLNVEAYRKHLYQLMAMHPHLDLSYSPNVEPPRHVTGSLSTRPGDSSWDVTLNWLPVYNGPQYTPYYRVSRKSSEGEMDIISGWLSAGEFVDTEALTGYEYTYRVQTAVSEFGEAAGPWGSGVTIRACVESCIPELYVDDDAPHDPEPGNMDISDPQEDGSRDHPFDSIQEAIEVAMPGARVRVRGGTYRESLDFLGKSLILSGVDRSEPLAFSYALLTGADEGPVLLFDKGETSASRLEGFVIQGGAHACTIHCEGSSPVISHCLVVGHLTAQDPDAGDAKGLCEAAVCCFQSEATFRNCTITENLTGMSLIDSPVQITHSIVWGNVFQDLCMLGTGEPVITYSNIGGYGSGPGNLDTDPYFVAWGSWSDSSGNLPSGSPPGSNAIWIPGDYHLRSESGHWAPVERMWLVDAISSPCIDAGDPDASVGLEIHPHGQRINIGAYGGTVEASRTPPDAP